VSRDQATPLMQQYRDIKARHQNAILLFRMGDFFETFYEDAEVASRALGLTLTSRNNGAAAEVPLAGVPAKAVNEYVRRLVQQGFRVAICEQVEDPRFAKGIVKREVIETITPGAAFSDDLLDGTRNNFLCALRAEGSRLGMAAADLSTGEFRLLCGTRADAGAMLGRLVPREVLAVAGDTPSAEVLRGFDVLLTERDAWEFDAALAGDALAQHFRVQSLDGLGLGEDDTLAIGAAGALLRYLRELQPGGVPHLARPIVERPGGTMPLDDMTRRNLELVESLRGGDTSGTLLSVLDRTQTPMGARLLRQWLLAPLVEQGAIDARLDAVGALVADASARAALRAALDGVRDVERLSGKTAAGRATPRDLRALGDSLGQLPAVLAALQRIPAAGLLHALRNEWDDAGPIREAITGTLVPRPPVVIGDGETIAAGVDAGLDELRAITAGGKDAIANLQAQERARTGIASLKVGYNRVFGYYIEITNANKDLVPGDYQRRQTLTGAERYVTPALKEFEEKVLHATERTEQLERQLFEALRARVAGEIGRLQQVAAALARLDVLAALADVAAREGYVRPEVSADFAMEITAGRHPVVERMMPRDQFIPNDVALTADARMIILTGPNMAGKSTILRQIGLIALMAQMGSWVPAARARLGIADRVFTRVGASDNLVRGQSTFMVEMAETSAILHTATARSLVLLDEIGRGTSTWDGVSIAWAVSEHLHDRVGCKTVFATHYHELTQLADELVAVRNYNVAVREAGDDVLFLHRLQPGGADRSYGIEVGRLAGLPAPVISRARALLRLLEGEDLAGALTAADGGGRRRVAADGDATPRTAAKREGRQPPTTQLGLFGGEPHPLMKQLADLDPNHLTPLEALARLATLVADAQQAVGHERPRKGS
jgi:DNA mismatch repair protein MutS